MTETKAKFKKGDGNPFGGKPKPGGGTPPPIANGSYVSWSGGKGRIDLIVTNGKVPGVEDDVEGTDKTPAARVVVWEDDKPTRKKIAKSTHTLKRIPPIGGFKKKTGEPVDVVTVLAQHEVKCAEMGLPEYTSVTGAAVKAVYDRGVAAWPGDEVTTLSPQEWALGRVEHFVKVAAVTEDVVPGNDVDLLAEDHPLRTEPLTPSLFEEAGVPVEPVDPPPGTEPVEPLPGTEEAAPPGDGDAVVVDMSDIEAALAALGVPDEE